RLVARIEWFGAFGLLLGAAYGFGADPRFANDPTGRLFDSALALVLFCTTSILALALASWVTRGHESPEGPRPFFWFARGPVSDGEARRYSFYAAAANGLAFAALFLLLPSLAQWHAEHSAREIPEVLFLFGLGFLPAIAATWLQFHWHRALGF